MPVPMLKSLANKSGKSISTAEKYWEEAKTSASKKFKKKDSHYWAYVAGIVKHRMGITESFKDFLNESVKLFELDDKSNSVLEDTNSASLCHFNRRR